jgi:Glycosyltransferase (GlcNAc)
MRRIFVHIASYRDGELAHTIQSALESAEAPELVSVGVCWQRRAGEDEWQIEPIAGDTRVRILPVDAHSSRGVCWARAAVWQLWQGEEFTLQIDSHLRFTKGWDVMSFSDSVNRLPSRLYTSKYPARDRTYQAGG